MHSRAAKTYVRRARLLQKDVVMSCRSFACINAGCACGNGRCCLLVLRK